MQYSALVRAAEDKEHKGSVKVISTTILTASMKRERVCNFTLRDEKSALFQKTVYKRVSFGKIDNFGV